MPDAPRSYESPPAGADAAGLEDYVVEASDGERIGTVVTVAEQEGEPFLVVEAGVPPAKRNRRAIPWSEVAEVDHDALTVSLRIGRRDVDAARAYEKSDESEGGDADAQRVTQPPGGVPAAGPTGDVAGPRDSSLWVVALASTLLGIFSALGIVIALSMKDVGNSGAWFALLIPVVLIGIGGLAGYRLWRNPYEGGTG